MTLRAKAQRVETGCGTMSMTLWEDNSFYADIKKCGGCSTSQAESNSRLIGLLLKNGVPIEEIIDQLKGIRCSSPCTFSLSCADAIAVGLKEMREEEKAAS